MKKILHILLLSFSLSLFSQEQGRMVLNPLTGEMEYVTNTYTMADSLINIGYGNNTSTSSLNTIIGYNNTMGDHSIALGRNNSVGCTENFVMGRNIRCDADRTITIGYGSSNLRARMPGSISLGMFSKWGILAVHSGYGMPNSGYVGDIGGVRIGWGFAYADGTTALEVIAHSDTASSKIMCACASTAR